MVGYRSSSKGDNNIVIGKKVGLPQGVSNAMNIGGVLFGTDLHSGLPDSASIVPANGRIGINVVNPMATLDVAGDVKATSLDISSTTSNTLTSVLARLAEGNNSGTGTYLGVKSYNTQATAGESDDNVKSFSIEHNFYGQLNSAINFYRGSSFTGGSIKFAVNNGTEIGKFHKDGLNVYGTIRTNEVKIELTDVSWPDFVFDPDYSLPSLKEVSTHIKEHKHLPGIPSETEVLTEGINLSEMQAKLLQKIEELTLYLIEQDNTINELKSEIKVLKESK